MSCGRFSERLDDYVDGALDSQETRRYEQHLAECRSCASEVEQLRSLLISARRLPRAIEPPRDLWPVIESRLRSMPVRAAPARESSVWLQIAAVVALLVFGLWVARFALNSQPSNHQLATETRAAPQDSSLNEQATLARSEDGIMLAKIDLLSTIEQSRGRLDEETLRQLESDMILLEEAIAEIRVALIEQPENRKLKLALAARYQQEIRFLQQVSRV